MTRTRRFDVVLFASAWLLTGALAPAHAAADAARGARLFRACEACHSTTPGVQMTGPSLARIWKRRAGTVPGFPRYSDAMQHAGIVWNETTLDRWLTDPQGLIPGTSMTFPGMREEQSREDVIAYLHAVSNGDAPPVDARGGMTMGMQSPKENLKAAPREGQVTSITHCKDTYTITTADGRVAKVWDFNLRFKTDSSDLGPRAGKPVIVGAGMQGDRASIVFSGPGEISRSIVERCP